MDQINLENMWTIMRENHFEIIDDVSSDYLCVICNNILINACNAHCGCRFCLDCIKGYLNGEKRKCPGKSRFCNLDLIDIERDIEINPLINKIISRIKVKCPNIYCQSQVELNTIGDHLKICENQYQSCPYFIMGCEEEKLGNDQVGKHLLTDIYHHTKLLMNWIRNSQSETNSLRVNVDKLREDNDELREKMRIEDGRRDKMNGYLHRQIRENLTEIENLGDEMVALKNSNRILKEKFKNLKEKKTEQISQLKTRLENQNKEIELIKQSFEMGGKKVDEIGYETTRDQDVEINEISQSNSTVEPEFMAIVQSIQNMKNATVDLVENFDHLQKVNNTTKYGKFRWKIDNWSNIERKARNRSQELIHSNLFYSHQNGYQMSLAMQPYDDHDYCLHFCFFIMRGSFDDSLLWPFNQVVEISFIDQKTGNSYKTKTKNCSKLPNNKKLQKPKGVMNEPFYLYYISLKEMRELVQDNQIFIKFSVKPVEDYISSSIR